MFVDDVASKLWYICVKNGTQQCTFHCFFSERRVPQLSCKKAHIYISYTDVWYTPGIRYTSTPQASRTAQQKENEEEEEEEERSNSRGSDGQTESQAACLLRQTWQSTINYGFMIVVSEQKNPVFIHVFSWVHFFFIHTILTILYSSAFRVIVTIYDIQHSSPITQTRRHTTKIPPLIGGLSTKKPSNPNPCRKRKRLEDQETAAVETTTPVQSVHTALGNRRSTGTGCSRHASVHNGWLQRSSKSCPLFFVRFPTSSETNYLRRREGEQRCLGLRRQRFANVLKRTALPL